MGSVGKFFERSFSTAWDNSIGTLSGGSWSAEKLFGTETGFFGDKNIFGVNMRHRHSRDSNNSLGESKDIGIGNDGNDEGEVESGDGVSEAGNVGGDADAAQTAANNSAAVQRGVYVGGGSPTFGFTEQDNGVPKVNRLGA